LGRPTEATRIRGGPLVDHQRSDRTGRRNPGLAREQEFVLITNDLDFSAILAATSNQYPSVVQVRTQDLLSDAAVRLVATAIGSFRTEIEAGSLLSIDEGGTRVRLLPLSRSQGLT
jgi:predicted nuclease of predicted toxin-antitoxin system